ncbi:hypothetical protein F2Q69_00007405 [Brassica cretica]|uniref:Uncharacterized protein n=1 Tax=Brassica cretica TaxID=69181 RepID=A0A8S9NSB9_BRACR|nr:hypothetical protein F2Q69_00007405 [Brassica cretica]
MNAERHLDCREHLHGYVKSSDQFVETNRLDRPWNSAGCSLGWTKSSSVNGRAGSNADSARLFSDLDQSSLANGRAGSNTDSARRFAELDQSSSANGRAGSNADTAQPFAELDRPESVFTLSS